MMKLKAWRMSLKMADNTTNSSSSFGFVGLLTLLFIALKLLGKITWSWWWVLAPLWISWVLFIVIIIFLYLTDNY